MKCWLAGQGGFCYAGIMHAPTWIARKRDGGELSPAEIRQWIEGYLSGEVTDYQMSAFCMAVWFRGMSLAETVALTEAIIASGERFCHPQGAPRVVDKHSTGGVGDKVSLVLAPLVACSGCWVPMVAGRGLGLTGGTLDKLEAIPGVNVRLDLGAAQAQLARIGVLIMGQTERFCPADMRLYALRDVTGTVPSIPLITASILAKKAAECLDALVLDVKFGRGAFMTQRSEAEALAASLAAVGREMGIAVTAQLHCMDEPTGHAVGNALEVIEAYECLRGAGPADLRNLVLDLAEAIAGVPRETMARWLDDGSARRKFEEMILAQGGNPDDLAHLADLRRAPVIVEVLANSTGMVGEVDAGRIARDALALGVGRARQSDLVDPTVGFDRLVKVGTSVNAGDLIGRVHARNQQDAQLAAGGLRAAVKILPD